MEESTADMLDARIRELLIRIDGATPGSPERADLIEELRSLHELKMAEDKQTLDIYEKMENLKEATVRRRWQVGIDIGKFLGELGGLAGLTYLVLAFEETGSIVSAAGRQILNKVFKNLF